MRILGRQRHVAHVRLTGSVKCLHGLEAGCVPGDKIERDSVAGEIVDGVGNVADDAQHFPLVRQRQRPTAGAHDRRVGDRKSDHGPLASTQRIDDGCPLLELASERIEYASRIAERAGKLVQDLYNLDSSLAVADEHRTHAFVLVIPRDSAGLALAVPIGALRKGSVARVADPVLRISHSDQEFRERLHQELDRIDAAVDLENPWRRSWRERCGRRRRRFASGPARECGLRPRGRSTTTAAHSPPSPRASLRPGAGAARSHSRTGRGRSRRRRKSKAHGTALSSSKTPDALDDIGDDAIDSLAVEHRDPER